jgi:hypothetical protein
MQANKERIEGAYADILSEDQDTNLSAIVAVLDRDLTTAYVTDPPPQVTAAIERLVDQRRREVKHLPPRRLRGMGLRRRLGMVAAVGLVVLVMGAAYGIIPIVDRAFFIDAGTQQILNGGLATRLNLSETQNGYTVTLQRAYADANRVVIGYIIHGPNGRSLTDTEKASLRDSLRDGSGNVLPPLGGGDFASGGAALDNFDASGVPSSTKNLALDFTIPQPTALAPGGPGISPPVTGSPFSFHFTVPFQGGRLATPDQTVTAGGTTVTLERVVISPSEARMYLQGLGGTGIYPDLTVAGWDSAKVSLPGWQPTEAGGILWSVWMTPGGTTVADFPAALMDKHGEWTLSIKAGPATADGRKVIGGPWVFHFVVP